ncbi:MAG: hypothetical protein ACE5DX_03660 [Candidatus Dojkabacteria bacterium]
MGRYDVLKSNFQEKPEGKTRGKSKKSKGRSKTGRTKHNQERKEESTKAPSEKIKEHTDKLHPLNSSDGNNPLAKAEKTQKYIAGFRRLLNFELVLSFITILIVLLLLFLILRNPVGVVTVDQLASEEISDEQSSDEGEGTVVTEDGKVFKDSRDVTSSSLEGSVEAQLPTKKYSNNDLGFTVKYFPDWKLTEKKVKGVTNTTLTDPDAKFETYISFQTKEPNCGDLSDEGTFNIRDIYSTDTIYRVEGYIKFGVAACASFPVIPDQFYVQYAGNVDESIIPIIETFSI